MRSGEAVMKPYSRGLKSEIDLRDREIGSLFYIVSLLGNKINLIVFDEKRKTSS